MILNTAWRKTNVASSPNWNVRTVKARETAGTSNCLQIGDPPWRKPRAYPGAAPPGPMRFPQKPREPHGGDTRQAGRPGRRAPAPVRPAWVPAPPPLGDASAGGRPPQSPARRTTRRLPRCPRPPRRPSRHTRSAPATRQPRSDTLRTRPPARPFACWLACSCPPPRSAPKSRGGGRRGKRSGARHSGKCSFRLPLLERARGHALRPRAGSLLFLPESISCAANIPGFISVPISFIACSEKCMQNSLCLKTKESN